MVQVWFKRNAQHQFSLEVKKVGFGAEIDKKSPPAGGSGPLNAQKGYKRASHKTNRQETLGQTNPWV